MLWERLQESGTIEELCDFALDHLCQNLDSFYLQTKELINKEKTHNLGIRKEELKQQLETYFNAIKTRFKQIEKELKGEE